MRHVLLGILWAFLFGVGLSLVSSLAICLGFDPEVRDFSDGASPLLGIFLAAVIVARNSSWQAGAWIGLSAVFLWMGLWAYFMGRTNPDLWVQEGLPGLTIAHLVWWTLAVAAGVAGGWVGRLRIPAWSLVLTAVCVIPAGSSAFEAREAGQKTRAVGDTNSGFTVTRQGPAGDGTIYYLLSFDFQRRPDLGVGIYDCDSDDAKPYDDSNTSYMGQGLEALVRKLSSRAANSPRSHLLCLINGGFFGASGLAVGRHEEPMVEDGRALYHVDLLRPKDQGCFFAINSPAAIAAGRPRFQIVPDIPWDKLGFYQTVLGGVRPLRMNGESVALSPGAGGTGLCCSRTSIGWSADGQKFFVLIVRDPDGELASQIQRRMHWSQTGGWDVPEVQRFWEQQGIPDALLFDGGESTQLAFRRPGGNYDYLFSGYQYSFTLGYLFQRPIRFALPILPPSEGHRGVLNYLYVVGP